MKRARACPGEAAGGALLGFELGNLLAQKGKVVKLALQLGAICHQVLQLAREQVALAAGGFEQLLLVSDFSVQVLQGGLLPRKVGVQLLGLLGQLLV